MADVLAAHDEVLDREVAVKLLRSGPAGVDAATVAMPAPGADGAAGRRQEAQARLLASLSHPHLVTVHDAHLDTDPPFFVMDLVPGPSLWRVLRDAGSLSAAHVAVLGAQLAAALGPLHRRGLVHRDVKPGNVLLTAAPTDDPADLDARLTDFGIARHEQEAHLTATGLVMGTAAYLSPEQARGEGVGPASDVYSLGLLLLECLTGDQAYPGPALESALARLHRPPTVPVGLPARLAGTLTAMTDPDPARRPPVADVERALRDAVPPGSPVAGPAATSILSTAPAATAVLPTASARTRALPSGGGQARRRPIAALLVGLVVLALVGVALLLGPLRGSPTPGAPAPAATPTTGPPSTPTRTAPTPTPVRTTPTPPPGQNGTPGKPTKSPKDKGKN